MNITFDESIKREMLKGSLTYDEILNIFKSQLNQAAKEVEEEKLARRAKELAEQKKQAEENAVKAARGKLVEATLHYLDVLGALDFLEKTVPMGELEVDLDKEFQGIEPMVKELCKMGEDGYETKITNGAKKASRITQQPFSIEDAFLKNFKANL